MIPMGPCYRYRAQVLRVIDGDTYVIRVDLGFRIGVDVEVRLHGYNCPELTAINGREAKAAVEAIVLGKTILVETYRDVRSFARWVADLYVDGEHLGDHLCRLGMASVRP